MKNRGILMGLLGSLLFPGLTFNASAEAFIENSLGTAADAAGFVAGSAGFSWENPAADAMRLGLFGTTAFTYAAVAARRTFSALAGVELSGFAGNLVPFGRISGAVDGDAVDGSGYQGAVDLSLTFNGAQTSLFMDGGGTLRGGTENSGDLYARLGFSRLWASLVLKPGVGVELAQTEGSLSSWAVQPALAASWYPGFPLSAAFSAGYRRTFDAAGQFDDSIPWSLELSGEPDERYGFSLYSSAEYGFSAWSGQATLELSLNLPDTRRFGSWLFLAGTLDYDGYESEPATRWELRSGVTLLF